MGGRPEWACIMIPGGKRDLVREVASLQTPAATAAAEYPKGNSTMFMNYYDIDNAQRRFARAGTPNRLRAAQIVARLAAWTDRNSDGWPHWSRPSRAASSLIGLIESRTSVENQAQEETDATDAELQAALRPIKAFFTRQGVSQEDRDYVLTGPLFEVLS